MKTDRNLQVYDTHVNILKMQEKTVAPFFTMIFFGSLILSSILTTLFIAPQTGLDSVISFIVSILVANLALFIAAVAYYFFSKDKAY